ALLAIAPGRAAAQTDAERIRAYDARFVVGHDGGLTVTERIDYDFGPNARHGIFRDIPVRFHYDKRYDRRYPLRVASVRATGASAQYKVTTSGGTEHIRIGDPG